MDVEEIRQRLEFEPQALPLSANLLAKCHINFDKVEQALAWLDLQSNHYIVTLSDTLYPPLLSQINDPPPVLFVKGDISSLLLPSIAVVGSRNASRGGLDMTTDLAYHLACQGFAITSGMATGIDGAAHRTALNANGKTIAVLGTGVECIYPKRHQHLYHDIINTGCVVSEYWPEIGPFASNFPRRNRIISGLSLGTVVVEASRKSGSLISARLAMEQNREVFAVPGSVLGGYSQGCHDLIKNGAKLVESAADIIEELGCLSDYHLEQLHQRHHIRDNDICNLPFPPLLASVGYETTAIDAVVEDSGKPIDLVLIQMLELELQGWVAAVPGGYVRLKRS